MPEITNKSEEQKVAEAEVESFRKELGPFVVAAETTRMPMVFTDAKEPGHPIIFANDAFLSLTGYEREEVLGQRFNFLMARGADPKALAQVEIAFGGSTDHGSEIRYRRKDGSVFWPPYSSARFGMRLVMSFSISRRSWTSPGSGRSKTKPRCSSAS